MNTERARRIVTDSIIVLGVASRLLPHPPNFTSINAVGIYGGARISGFRAYLLPVICMLVTDPILGALYGFAPFSRITPIIYLSLLINVWIGQRLQQNVFAMPVGVAGVIASLQFFLLTNLAVWMFGSLYPQNAPGLLACYVAALPFLAWNVAGTWLYSLALFGADAVVARKLRSVPT